MKRIIILKDDIPVVIGYSHLNILFNRKLDPAFFDLLDKRIAVNYVIKNKSVRLFYKEVDDNINQQQLIQLIIDNIKNSGKKATTKVDSLILYFGDFPKLKIK